MLKLVQRAGQRTFLAVERVFNRAFGDALNPFYSLGAISHFLLWIVVGSGLYLYAFFETGVAQAYDSVQAFGVRQPYAGGLLRSLHRYASDGMVLTMLLHVVRHFTFDHYRAFRWFSWVSGVVLLWLVYISGINGYMLPWDRLAQFTAVATAEWLDALPLFGGTLIRNFISPDAVSDRLFSLLSFLHIGLPLGVLALLWVHTQRVPGARTMPPRPTALALTAALVVLSLVKPAISGPPADLATVPAVVPIDWYYLPVLPLVYRWGPQTLWLVAGGATLLALLLPWLPPKRLGRDDRHILFRPDNRIVAARPGETILEAALRERLPFPYECRNGGCGECKCRVDYGDVEMGPSQESALTADERASGHVLACVAVARGDVEIEYVPRAAAGGIPVRVRTARVVAMARAADDVMIVRLTPDDGPLPFYAGQYLNVLLDDGQRRSFSFATAPHEYETIELQIRRIPGGRFTSHVFTAMKVGDALRFEGPLGSFFLREDSDKPIIFVAGATGFAPVKSMIEHAFHLGMKRRMILYWGTRTLSGMYARSLCERWTREHPNFTFVPVLSDPLPEDRWEGRTGLVHEAILTDFGNLAGHQLYACGSTAMVEAAHPAFRARGLAQDDCFSDAFRLAPHRAASAAGADVVRLGGAS